MAANPKPGVTGIILQQLGGKGRLCGMLNAKDYVGGENSLAFRHMSGPGPRGAVNRTQIWLNGRDLYDVECHFIRGGKAHFRSRVDNVPVENLRAVFEGSTGLRVQL